MAERDKSQPIRISGMGEPPEGIHEEIVCYTVVTGRGRALIRHLRDRKSRDFANRLVASYRGFEDIRARLAEFDGTEWTDRRDRRIGRKRLITVIRKIIEGVPA
jgi:hypothetical protein